MKLGDQLLLYRKKSGLSQEQLGEEIGVTRQTVSNWELGETSPNPEQLKKLSKVLNVSVDELLNNDIQNVLVEKVNHTEKLSTIILAILKFFLLMIVIGVSIVLFYLVMHIIHPEDTGRRMNESIYCELYGEKHGFTIEYEEYTGQVLTASGDMYFYDILDLDQYQDAHQIFNIINDYVKKNGGVCIRFSDRDLNDLVTMEIKEGTLTKTGATVLVYENADYAITIGEEFWIEKYDSNTNTYERLLQSKNCFFNLPAYNLEIEKPKELIQDWTSCYGELEPGTYRLVKNAHFGSNRPFSESDQFLIWVDFEIE